MERSCDQVCNALFSIMRFGLFINTYRDKGVEIFLLQPPFFSCDLQAFTIDSKKKKEYTKKVAMRKFLED